MLYNEGMRLEKGRKLPKEIQQYVNIIVGHLVETEKKSYENPLVPFSQHSEAMKLQAEEHIVNLHTELQRGQQVLKERFIAQEKQNPKISQDALFSTWEKASLEMKNKLNDPALISSKMDTSKPLQELLGLSWAFMDRAYQTANTLLSEKQYEDAESVYLFLCFLNPAVFEYWLCAATCQQVNGKLEEALNTYTTTLQLHPEHPFVFFQMASCYSEAKDQEACMKALDQSIEYAAEKSEYAAILQDATQMKQALIAQRTG